MKPIFPSAVLSQHIAVLGKTGSGKTSTAKLAVEQIVSDGSRVCILDPIKSDWWGLTSSTDGKKAGLPFCILGGPRGHVPLHSQAGKAIAEIVAGGTLPLSIIDMADFGPGGQAQFFIDFAPVLLRKMKGVLYLVMEEAHLFAPKERSGIGQENMAIHWAKTIAQAGRSKGIRLIVLTQRTQALHNAILGGCETIITHRLTAPADQKPVLDWLAANTDRETKEKVSASLSSLKTGEGWICSGEAQLFERRQFPRIATYDNSATPTDDSEAGDVKTAAIDQEKLRGLIGAAVDQAKADDPKELRKKIAELEKQLKAKPSAAADPKAIERAISVALAARDNVWKSQLREIKDEADRVVRDTDKALAAAKAIAARAQYFLVAESKVVTPPAKVITHQVKENRPAPLKPVYQPRKETAGDQQLGKCERAILQVLANFPEGCDSGKLTLLSGYRFSGGFRNSLAALRSHDLIEGSNSGVLRITDAGHACGPFELLPTGQDLIDYWLSHSSFGLCERTILKALVDAYPAALTAEELCRVTDYEFSGGFRNALSDLRKSGVMTGRNNGTLKASDHLFEGA